MIVNDWTPKALQQLHHAVTQVDYRSLFAYYGYRVGFPNGGCWLIAKAIQQVAGGELHYVKVNVDAAYVGDFVHTVVKLGDDNLRQWPWVTHERATASTMVTP